jgi:hypothetical protein
VAVVATDHRSTVANLALVVGDKFPETQILGMDLSPIQPVFVPPNVKFVLDDIEHDNGWDLPENHFDFIHVRHTLHSIRNRPKLMERIFR